MLDYGTFANADFKNVALLAASESRVYDLT